MDMTGSNSLNMRPLFGGYAFQGKYHKLVFEYDCLLYFLLNSVYHPDFVKINVSLWQKKRTNLCSKQRKRTSQEVVSTVARSISQYRHLRQTRYRVHWQTKCSIVHLFNQISENLEIKTDKKINLRKAFLISKVCKLLSNLRRRYSRDAVL